MFFPGHTGQKMDQSKIFRSNICSTQSKKAKIVIHHRELSDHPKIFFISSSMGNIFPGVQWDIIAESLEAVEAEDNTEAGANEGTEHKHRGNRHRDRGYALQEVDHLSDNEFSSMFRMSREAFHRLLSLVAPFMHDTNETMAILSSGGPVSKATKLYCTLRYLAGGSYLDITFAWGVAKSTFFATDPEKGIIWPTMEAIDQVFTIGLPMHNCEELDKIAAEFAKYSHGELKHCVMAIDGWVAKTRKPFNSEVVDVVAYRNRHDCWGLVVLAGCDAHCRFNMFSCMNAGSTNDVMAWELSQMKKDIDAGRLPKKYYIIGDEAFVCTNQLLVPYSGRQLGKRKDSFNYHLSAMRQVIERSFALLVQRWGILWRSLRCSFKRWTLVLSVCAKLHNFCIDENIPIAHNRYYEDQEDGDIAEVILNEHENPAPPTYADRRLALTRFLQDRGQKRPDFAAMNSREH